MNVTGQGNALFPHPGKNWCARHAEERGCRRITYPVWELKNKRMATRIHSQVRRIHRKAARKNGTDASYFFQFSPSHSAVVTAYEAPDGSCEAKHTLPS